METPTILVVEDEPDVRKLVAMSLKQTKYQIITAKDGVEALKYCEEHIPHLILLDISMPRVNGLDLLYLLNDMELLAQTQVIMLTALGYQEIVHEAMSYGVKDFILKPFVVRDLLQRVERLMVPETG